MLTTFSTYLICPQNVLKFCSLLKNLFFHFIISCLEEAHKGSLRINFFAKSFLRNVSLKLTLSFSPPLFQTHTHTHTHTNTHTKKVVYFDQQMGLHNHIAGGNKNFLCFCIFFPQKRAQMGGC